MKNKSSFLEYKFLFQKYKESKEQYSEGELDLHFRLSFFQKENLEKKSNYQNGDTFHQAKNSKAESPNLDTDNLLESDNSFNNVEIKKSSHPYWLKKIYRKVVSIIHPDKLESLSSEHLKKMYKEWYLIATKSYEKENYEDVLLIANNLELELESKEVFNVVTKGIENKKIEINKIVKMLGYQWFHVKEENRDKAFIDILKQLGFVCENKERVED